MKDQTKTPFQFDEFFATGMAEAVSPFLTPSSRKWGINLQIRTAILSCILLALSFAFRAHPPLSTILLATVYFISGTPALLKSLADLRNFEVNIEVLMTLAALLSAIIGSPFEGGLLLVLFELSGAMEELVSMKTKSAILELNKISPKTAQVITPSGSILQRSVRDVIPGDLIMIRAGDTIPLDGIVTSGSSFLNRVHLTGESTPVSKTKGDLVEAGSINTDGSLTVKVTTLSTDSTLSRIIKLITEAQEAKPAVQRFLDTFSKRYAVTIISLSALFALLMPHFLSIPYLSTPTVEGSIYRSLAFLIAASPCALIIATPTAYLSALSACAKKGVLLKGGVILDTIAEVNAIALDKTGTLTTGALTLSSFLPLGPTSPSSLNDALGIAAELEKRDAHPISRAIVSHAEKEQSPRKEIEAFRSIPGSGLEGISNWNGKKEKIYIGHAAFIKSLAPLHLQNEIRSSGSFMLIGDHSLYAFTFIDELREGIAATLAKLKKKYSIFLSILTGDHSENAKEVADKLGIDDYSSGLSPKDKLDRVTELSKIYNLAMVGDGINDAPALARASVGISMGKMGSATAVEASDVVFVHDDLRLIEWLIGKSRQTVRIVRQNLFIAIGVIAIIPFLSLKGVIPLWLAVIFHEGGTVLVGLNSLRLLRK